MALADLYREVLLGHYRAPRNRGEVSQPDLDAKEENPLCGDEVRVTGRVNEGTIAEVKFEARGCVICVSSASMMTEAVAGRTLDAANGLVAEVEGIVGGTREGSGDLAALGGVRDYPGRLRCATLAWTTLARGIREMRKRTGGSSSEF